MLHLDSKASQEKLENDFKELRENYERLIAINKRLNEQTKDKEYALEVNIEEFRNGYEQAKAENIKLKDNLETQNKLWKIWLEKFDGTQNREIINAETSENLTSKVDNDDEILLIEDEDDTEGDETDFIYQQYLNNQKQSGHAAKTIVEEEVKCNICSFTAKSKFKLREHIANIHKEKSQRRPNVIQYCHFWNNTGSCSYEAKNGKPCKFAHQKALICKFDGVCGRKRCMYSHQRQNQPFLAPPPGVFSHPFMNQPYNSMWIPPPPPHLQQQYSRNRGPPRRMVMRNQN